MKKKIFRNEYEKHINCRLLKLLMLIMIIILLNNSLVINNNSFVINFDRRCRYEYLLIVIYNIIIPIYSHYISFPVCNTLLINLRNVLF